MKGLFDGGAEASLGHRGIGLGARRLRSRRFRGAFIAAEDALEVGGDLSVVEGRCWDGLGW